MKYGHIQGCRQDSNESLFFSRELEQIEQTLIEDPLPEIRHPTFIPTTTEADAATAKVTWRQLQRLGEAKIGARGSLDDAPMVNLHAAEASNTVRAIYDGFEYTYFEVAEGALTGRSLDREGPMTAREVIMRKLESVAAIGDATHNLEGLCNYSGVTSAQVAADGDGSSRLWTAKTADLILRDLNAPILSMLGDTNEIEVPDTMLLPPVNYAYIASTPRSSTSDTTILEYFLKSQPWIKTVGTWPYLTTLGSGTTTRGVVYARNPMKVDLRNPLGFVQLAPAWLGSKWRVVCAMTTIGVRVKRLKSMRYFDSF